MRIDTGHYIVAIIFLLFVLGTSCLVLDSLLYKPKNIAPPQLDPEYEDAKKYHTYTVNLYQDDELSIL